MATLNEMLKNMEIHKNFYIRGVVNSLLPEFANPLDTSITEKNISGEAIELLRTIAEKHHPDLQEGQVRQMSSYAMLFDDPDASLSNALGNFGLTKKDGKYVVFDTYDFAPTEDVYGIDNFVDAVRTSVQDKDPFMVARYIAGKLMPENPDGSSREDAMRVRIEIPNEPDIIDTEYDDDIPEGAKDFVFAGPMTNKRFSLWKTFSGSM